MPSRMTLKFGWAGVTNNRAHRLFDSTTMRNANTNIQLNIGNSGALVIKNTAQLLGGMVLVGMVVMSTLYRSISADSPSKLLPS